MPAYIFRNISLVLGKAQDRGGGPEKLLVCESYYKHTTRTKGTSKCCGQCPLHLSLSLRLTRSSTGIRPALIQRRHMGALTAEWPSKSTKPPRLHAPDIQVHVITGNHHLRPHTEQGTLQEHDCGQMELSSDVATSSRWHTSHSQAHYTSLYAQLGTSWGTKGRGCCRSLVHFTWVSSWLTKDRSTAPARVPLARVCRARATAVAAARNDVGTGATGCHASGLHRSRHTRRHTGVASSILWYAPPEVAPCSPAPGGRDPFPRHKQ